MPVQEMWVWSLGQEDALEKKMAIHFSILAWVMPEPEGPGGLGVLLLLLQVNHTATLRGLYYYHQHFRELEKQKCRV